MKGTTAAATPSTSTDGSLECRPTWTTVGAHTGTQVWATNLQGQDVDYSSSDLISPAIGLIGGNRDAALLAVLRLFQSGRERGTIRSGILSSRPRRLP